MKMRLVSNTVWVCKNDDSVKYKREEGEHGGGDDNDGNESTMVMVSKSCGLIQLMGQGLHTSG